jgi:general secretion pathway protein G
LATVCTVSATHAELIDFFVSLFDDKKFALRGDVVMKKAIYCSRKPLVNHFGFTLIELMVVMVILGILAGLIVPRIMDRPEEARRTKAGVQIQSIEQALKLYKLDNGQYPTTEQGLQALVEPPSAGTLARNGVPAGTLKRAGCPRIPGTTILFISARTARRFRPQFLRPGCPGRW